MTFDFDEIIDRRNTSAMAKQGFRDYLFGGQDPVVLPCPDDEMISMWVADMAFASAPAAREAMIARITDHPILGYTGVFGSDFYDTFARWCDDHYCWRPEAEHLLTSRGIVPALFDFVKLYVGPDEAVVTLTPAYGYFKHPVERYGRELVTCALVEDDHGRHSIDFDDFAAKIANPRVRLFFLCHPHNPTGRHWTDPELQQMTEICAEHDVLVISDEIHCDLLRVGRTHTPLAKLMPGYDKIITCMSSSKTFNLAGLGIASVIIPNESLREVWIDNAFPVVNPVSVAAATGVFANGHDWHRQLLTYLDENFAYIDEVIAERLPQARFVVPEATYLAWINLSAYFPPELNLTRYFAEAAGVLVEGGDMFVADADGHIRLNAACPRATLETALGQIISATTSFADR